MLNSTATIFTMDLYKPYFSKRTDGTDLIPTGRIAVIPALLIAVIMAPALDTMSQMFQYNQEYTGLVSPGILAVFLYERGVPGSESWGMIVDYQFPMSDLNRNTVRFRTNHSILLTPLTNNNSIIS